MDIEIGQALSPLVSALERAAELMQSGVQPARALKQVVGELEAYAAAHHRQAIPARPFKLSEKKAA